jgi:guanylate kinase
MEKKKIIIIGKAASGKDFLQKQLVLNGWVPLKQYTTRPKRPNENGDEYHFVSDEEFDKMIHNLISVQCFNGWKYGFDIEEALSSEVMIFSPANYFTMIESSDSLCHMLFMNSIVVYLDIDEKTRRERLSVRYVGGNEDDSLERRFQADKKDFEFFDNINWNEKTNDIVRLCSVNEVNDFLKKILS